MKSIYYQFIICPTYDQNSSPIKKFRYLYHLNGEITTPHGAIVGKTQTKSVTCYNLKAIIAVGYRVNSHIATEFRKRATETLHQYIIR